MNIVGIDVSKKKLDCALLKERVNTPLNKQVANTATGFQSLVTWCCRKAECEPHNLHIILEATGPYHEAAAEAMYEFGTKVSVVNPAKTKYFGQSLGVKAKNDRLDCKRP